MKRAILVISFGTSYADTLKNTIKAVEDSLEAAFKTKVFRAFSGELVIGKLKERYGIETDNVHTALERLSENGYTDIFCVPTYITSGAEYEKVCAEIEKFKKRLNVKISCPLISSKNDCRTVAGIFSKRLTDKNRLYVFAAHGSEGRENSFYPLIEECFRELGTDNAYIGAVRGGSGIDTVLKRATKRNIKNVTLMPFMLVSGAHARNDMAAAWKNELERNGFNVECDFTGLGEIKEIRDMYIEHLRDIWQGEFNDEYREK